MSLGDKIYGLERGAQWLRVLLHRPKEWTLDPSTHVVSWASLQIISTKWDRDRMITLLASSLVRYCELRFREKLPSKE